MSTTVHRTPASKTQERQSLFFCDLASPISPQRPSRFATPGQAAAVSALWRENFSGASDKTPQPPVFTLEDRIDFSPEPALHDLPPASPESAPDPKTSAPGWNYFSNPSPLRPRAAAAAAGCANGGIERNTPGSGGWWATHPGSEEKGSPVDGVVKSSGPGTGALVMLPPPREVARPNMKRSQLVPARDGMMDEEEWVTVYGFPPGDTNLVLREFEKCGAILKHITGPRDANWMHILYQNRYDAQRAFGKNDMQLSSVLVIGVKPVDPVQCQYLNERLNSNTAGGFMVSLPPQSAVARSVALSPVAASPRNLQNGGTMTNEGAHPSTGAIASPAKSVVSKVMDLMFGF